MAEHVEPMKLLGSTWARRDWRYFLRRLWIAVGSILLAAAETALAVVIWSNLVRFTNSQLSEALISALFVVMIAGRIAVAAWAGWRLLEAQRHIDVTTVHVIADRGRNCGKGGVAGALLGVGALAGFPAALLAIGFGAFMVLGWLYLGVVSSFLPFRSAEEYLAFHELKVSH